MIAYAITTPTCFNPYTSIDFIQNLKANFLLYRDKENLNYAKDAKAFMKLIKIRSDIKAFLHQDYLLAKKLQAFGVHLNSKQFSDIKKAKALNLFTIISTHSFEEIKKAKELGADAVTFSPIFATPNKGEPKGIEALYKATTFGIKVIALGGIISQEQIELIKNTNCFGFASIRYFCH